MPEIQFDFSGEEEFFRRILRANGGVPIDITDDEWEWETLPPIMYSLPGGILFLFQMREYYYDFYLAEPSLT